MSGFVSGYPYLTSAVHARRTAGDDSLKRFPTGPEADILAVPTTRVPLDVSLRDLADTVRAQKINKGAHCWQHAPPGRKNDLNLAERSQEIGQNNLQQALSD